MLWVCSSRPLELHFVRAWDCCQQVAAALADQHGDSKCVKTTSESHVHFTKHSPGEMKARPSIAQNITTTRNQTAAMTGHTYIAPFTMEWRLVSCLRRLRLPTPIWLLCQFECRSHQAHRYMFPHFRPLVTLSTVSWFCCRSRCRSVSSWCRVSLLPLEFCRPSARTQSP